MKNVQELVRQYANLLDTEESNSFFSRAFDKAASYVFSEEKIVLKRLDMERVQELSRKHQLPPSRTVLMYVDLNRKGEINDSSVLITEQELSVFHGFKKTATGFRLRWEDITAVEKGDANWLFVCGLGKFQTRVVIPVSYLIGDKIKDKEKHFFDFLQEAVYNKTHPFSTSYDAAEQFAEQHKPEKLDKLYARLNFDPEYYFEPMYFAAAARAGNSEAVSFLQKARAAMDERFAGLYSLEARQEQDLLEKIESTMHEYKLDEGIALCEKYVEEFGEESSAVVFQYALGALDEQQSALNADAFPDQIEWERLNLKVAKFRKAQKKAEKKRAQVESDMEKLHPLKPLWLKCETMLAVVEASVPQSNRALYEEIIRLGRLEKECSELSGHNLSESDARWVKSQPETLKACKEPLLAAFKESFTAMPPEERKFVMLQDQLPLKAPAAGYALTPEITPDSISFGQESRKTGETLIAHPIETNKYFTRDELSLYDQREKAAELESIFSALGAEEISIEYETELEEKTEAALSKDVKAFADGETMKQVSKGLTSVTKFIEIAGEAVSKKIAASNEETGAKTGESVSSAGSPKSKVPSKTEGITPAGEVNVAQLQRALNAAQNYLKSSVKTKTISQVNSSPHLPDEQKLKYFHREKEWQHFAESRLNGKNSEMEKTITISSNSANDYSSNEYHKASACLRLSAVTAGTGIGSEKETSEEKMIAGRFSSRLKVSAKFASLFEPEIMIAVKDAEGQPFANRVVIAERENEAPMSMFTDEEGKMAAPNIKRDSVLKLRAPGHGEDEAIKVKIRFDQSEYVVHMPNAIYTIELFGEKGIISGGKRLKKAQCFVLYEHRGQLVEKAFHADHTGAFLWNNPPINIPITFELRDETGKRTQIAYKTFKGEEENRKVEVHFGE